MKIIINSAMRKLLKEKTNELSFENISVAKINSKFISTNGILEPITDNQGKWYYDTIKLSIEHFTKVKKYKYYYNCVKVDRYFCKQELSIEQYLNISYIIGGIWIGLMKSHYIDHIFYLTIQYSEEDLTANVPYGFFIKIFDSSNYKAYFKGKGVRSVKIPYITVRL